MGSNPSTLTRELFMDLIKRRTNCYIYGHGTRCEVAVERANRFPRSSEERLALKYELQSELGEDEEAEK